MTLTKNKLCLRQIYVYDFWGCPKVMADYAHIVKEIIEIVGLYLAILLIRMLTEKLIYLKKKTLF